MSPSTSQTGSSNSIRAHFRVDYPTAHRGKLIVQNKAYEIIDISEKGLKFHSSQPEFWQPGQHITGEVILLIAESHTFGATIIRVDDETIAIALDDPIPLKYMFDEHRFVLKNFGQELAKKPKD